MPECGIFSPPDCFPHMELIWRHAKSFKALCDDRLDSVSLPSLGRSLQRNRKVLEDLSKSAAKRSVEMSSLKELYGENWFKCRKLSCFYFHEGFDSRAARQSHFDRHDRPFSCEEEDCPAARIGFASLREMEKHKRNMHPGIDKLSSTFARLKKNKDDPAALQKYPCPRCPLKFITRLERRRHMIVHNPQLYPRPIGQGRPNGG